MAILFRFSLLFCFGFFTVWSSEASNPTFRSQIFQSAVDSCDAPAPDSFRVTTIGSDFLSVKWNPAWQGAEHTVWVAEKDTNGGWIQVRLFQHVAGSSLTIDSLSAGKRYRIRVATHCQGKNDIGPLGDPVEGVTTILELTLIGRTPQNPVPIDCQGIKYKEHNWIGFRVSKEGLTNTFEIVMNQSNDPEPNPTAYIRRVTEIHPIVAASSAEVYPNSIIKEIYPVLSPFKMLHLGGGNNGEILTIGEIEFQVNNTNPPTINVCINDSPVKDSWRLEYDFEVLKSNLALPPNGGGGNGSGLPGHSTSIDFRVQSPFDDYLNIFVSPKPTEKDSMLARLFNISGQLIAEFEIPSNGDVHSWPIFGIPNGLYIIAIYNDGNVFTTKTIKKG